MPPKRKAPSAKPKGRAKVAKMEEEEEKTVLKKVLSDLRKVSHTKKEQHSLDKFYPNAQGRVYEDYDCMLNKTDIKDNNNKYYIIQLIEEPLSRYFVWTRWGRVGESGQNQRHGPINDVKSAIKIFEKKYADKTKNQWDKRDSFVFKPGMYTLMELADETDENPNNASLQISGASVTLPCKLEKPTQAIIERIFSVDTFKNAMKNLNIDVKKMPLGKLSTSQIAKAFEILDEIEEVLQNKKKSNIAQLSSRFYTLVPHDFGRQRPPVINTMEMVREKMDMLLILSDIELAQSVCKSAASSVKQTTTPHPCDQNYSLLQCDLQWLDPEEEEYKLITDFMTNTKTEYDTCKLLNIWRVDRQGEKDRFRRHASLSNRKLLWHGTNIAVIVAILKTGLRIMPHSGGRVGKGIYFASLFQKSRSYTSSDSANHALIFLCEVVLGKEKHILRNNKSLVKPPNGFDSVVALGSYECDFNNSKKLILDQKEVIVPYSKPIRRDKVGSFYHSEYLIYEESQCRIRYMIELHS